MHEGIYIAASAGLKQGKKLEVIANNLANVNNTGYKRDRLVFKEFMPPYAPDAGLEAGKNILLPAEKSNSNVAYVGISDYYTDLTPGALKQTLKGEKANTNGRIGDARTVKNKNEDETMTRTAITGTGGNTSPNTSST